MAQFTQREFLFLDDLLHMEELQVKQLSDWAGHCSDPQISSLCFDLARHSQQNFDTLLGHLNQGQGRQGMQAQAQAGGGFYQSGSSMPGNTYGQ